MGAKLMGFARQDQRRARTQARRLATLLKQYHADPEDNFWMRSEAVTLAHRISVRVRLAKEIERVIRPERDEPSLVLVPVTLQSTAFHV
jgi:hypothetical protein